MTLENSAFLLHAHDSVAIARVPLERGTEVLGKVAVRTRILPGHKVALRPHDAGEPVHRYGQIIGFASQPIAPGEHVHVHNLDVGSFDKNYAFCEGRIATVPIEPQAHFMGIKRPDGRAATRNYVGILTSVNCSAHVADMVARAFQRDPITGRDPLAA